MREFLRERGLSHEDNEPNQPIKSNEKSPEPATLLEIYKEQFHYIHKLETRNLALFAGVVVISVALWILAALPFLEINHHHLFGVIGIFTLLSAAANHITINNTAKKWSRSLTLGQIEKALGLRNSNIVPSSTQFVLPVSFGDFVVRFLFSTSGPKVLVYTLLMVLGIIEFQWDILGVQSLSLFGLLLIIPFLLATASIYFNYIDIIHQFKAMKGEVELGTRTGMKSPADQYCDVADALLQMRPPLPSEALMNFREALRLEPDNVRARVGFDKLANWQTKNNN